MADRMEQLEVRGIATDGGSNGKKEATDHMAHIETGFRVCYVYLFLPERTHTTRFGCFIV